MKRFVVVAALAGILVVALTAVALAAPPTPQAGETYGPGSGIHAPGTGLANGSMPGAGLAQGRQGVGGGMMRGAPQWAGQPDEVQTLLGMTEEQIQAERQAGKSLAQIAAGKNITKESLVSAILNAKKGILDQQVAAGKLTQAQADAVYANMQQQALLMVDRTDVGPGCGQPAGQTTAPLAGRVGGMGGRWSR